MNLNELNKILNILNDDANITICIKNQYGSEILAKIDKVILTDVDNITLYGDVTVVE